MESQPRKMRSEGLSLGLTLCPEMLRAVLSLTAAVLGALEKPAPRAMQALFKPIPISPPIKAVFPR